MIPSKSLTSWCVTRGKGWPFEVQTSFYEPQSFWFCTTRVKSSTKLSTAPLKTSWTSVGKSKWFRSYALCQHHTGAEADMPICGGWRCFSSIQNASLTYPGDG